MMMAIVACSTQAPQPQNENVVNGTREVPVVPEGTFTNDTNAAVAPGSSAATPADQANDAGAEQPKPEQVLQQYATLLEQRRFADALALWDPSATSLGKEKFAAQFDDFKTIHAAVGKVGRIEGAAGSLYSDIQLTLSGNRKDGSPYTVTGPVTLRRVNDVPGSTAEQRRWRIVKMELTANPKTAESLIKG